MPALVSRSDGSSGMREDEGMRLQPFSSKKLRYFSRISALVIYSMFAFFPSPRGPPRDPLFPVLALPVARAATRAPATPLAPSTMTRPLVGLGPTLPDALEGSRDVGMRRRRVDDGVDFVTCRRGSMEEHSVLAHELPARALLEIIHEIGLRDGDSRNGCEHA